MLEVEQPMLAMPPLAHRHTELESDRLPIIKQYSGQQHAGREPSRQGLEQAKQTWAAPRPAADALGAPTLHTRPASMGVAPGTEGGKSRSAPRQDAAWKSSMAPGGTMPFGFATLGRADDGLAPRKAAPGAAYMAAFNNAFPAGFKKIGMGPAAGRKIPANATVGRVSPAKQHLVDIRSGKSTERASQPSHSHVLVGAQVSTANGGSRLPRVMASHPVMGASAGAAHLYSVPIQTAIKPPENRVGTTSPSLSSTYGHGQPGAFGGLSASKSYGPFGGMPTGLAKPLATQYHPVLRMRTSPSGSVGEPGTWGRPAHTQAHAQQAMQGSLPMPSAAALQLLDAQSAAEATDAFPGSTMQGYDMGSTFGSAMAGTVPPHVMDMVSAMAREPPPKIKFTHPAAGRLPVLPRPQEVLASWLAAQTPPPRPTEATMHAAHAPTGAPPLGSSPMMAGAIGASGPGMGIHTPMFQRRATTPQKPTMALLEPGMEGSLRRGSPSTAVATLASGLGATRPPLSPSVPRGRASDASSHTSSSSDALPRLPQHVVIDAAEVLGLDPDIKPEAEASQASGIQGSSATAAPGLAPGASVSEPGQTEGLSSDLDSDLESEESTGAAAGEAAQELAAVADEGVGVSDEVQAASSSFPAQTEEEQQRVDAAAAAEALPTLTTPASGEGGDDAAAFRSTAQAAPERLDAGEELGDADPATSAPATASAGDKSEEQRVAADVATSGPDTEHADGDSSEAEALNQPTLERPSSLRESDSDSRPVGLLEAAGLEARSEPPLEEVGTSREAGVPTLEGSASQEEVEAGAEAVPSSGQTEPAVQHVSAASTLEATAGDGAAAGEQDETQLAAADATSRPAEPESKAGGEAEAAEQASASLREQSDQHGAKAAPGDAAIDDVPQAEAGAEAAEAEHRAQAEAGAEAQAEERAHEQAEAEAEAGAEAEADARTGDRADAEAEAETRPSDLDQAAGSTDAAPLPQAIEIHDGVMLIPSLMDKSCLDDVVDGLVSELPERTASGVPGAEASKAEEDLAEAEASAHADAAEPSAAEQEGPANECGAGGDAAAATALGAGPSAAASSSLGSSPSSSNLVSEASRPSQTSGGAAAAEPAPASGTSRMPPLDMSALRTSHAVAHSAPASSPASGAVDDDFGLDDEELLSDADTAEFADLAPATSGMEELQEGEAQLLSVSASGYSKVTLIPSRPTSTVAGRSENDVTVDGVRILGGKYEVQHVVGEGAYGLVMKCKLADGSGKHVAIKSFKIEDDDPDAEDVKRTSKREVALLRALQHPHVVGLVDEFYVCDRLFIVMEFVPCNLLELLEASPGGMDREAIRLIMYQLCTAMAFIHSKAVVYRDIKPENVLVDEVGCLKLCDFGFARYMNAPGEPLTDYVATRWYRAPELLLGPPYQGDGGTVQFMYGTPIDMWAIGCLMGELMDGEPLFPGDSDLDQLYRIQQVLGPLIPSHQDMFSTNPQNSGIYFNFKDQISLSKRYDRMDSVELDFMAGLLCMDPDKRLTGEQCLKHPYLASLAGADIMSGVSAHLVPSRRQSELGMHDSRVGGSQSSCGSSASSSLSNHTSSDGAGSMMPLAGRATQ